jgi:transcriptional regulator with XRE-family HTH domain|nr:hypothetical protein [uncultured bacterium]
MKKDTSRNLTTLSEAKDAQAFAYNKEHYGVVIRNYRKKMGFTQQQIAESIGVSKSHIANWEAGRARPDLNLVPALCLTLGIDVSTFFGIPSGINALMGKERLLLSGYRKLGSRDKLILETTLNKMLELSEEELYERCRVSFLPIMHNYQQAAAGSGMALDAATEQYQTFVRKNRNALMADEIVTVNGSSMEPTFQHGQDVYIQHTQELEPGEIGLFVVNGDGYIKQWAKNRLHSLNPVFPDIMLNETDDIRCIGRVLGAVDPEDYPTAEEDVVLQELMKENAFPVNR